MSWIPLLLLAACPIMMLFCMKGMSGGKKEKCNTSKAKTGLEKPNDVQTLEMQVAELMAKNEELTKSVQALKSSPSHNSGQVIELKQKREIS
ncbi:DUF2933 domain-containing protein [Bacillus fonticola]|uniref:DUF2933 domain-containing protein n=1 Tax=Bacillus fonticola TaxID=2728853 RepID=UPI001475DC59|nr:DUF2933 domain-containing protein [Bacillus fonticola]